MWAPSGHIVFSVRGLADRRFLTIVEQASTAAGGWKVTDYELSGLDGRVVAIEARSASELVIASVTGVFRVDLDALTPASGALAERVPGGSMRRPACIEISDGKQAVYFDVLDTHCGS